MCVSYAAIITEYIAARVEKITLKCILDPHFGEVKVVGIKIGTIRKSDDGIQ